MNNYEQIAKENHEKYHFFWNGPFSQWHSSEIAVDDIKFNCAEQYMMFSKACLFGDRDTAAKILKEKSPKEQKKLGRSVSGFDPIEWNKHCKSIVYVANYAKFSQNSDLFGFLLETGDKILVEASPYDSIWGIGLDIEIAMITPDTEWKGTNFLGRILTLVRNDLKESYTFHVQV